MLPLTAMYNIVQHCTTIYSVQSSQQCTTVYNPLQHYTTLYIHVQPFNNIVHQWITLYNIVQTRTTVYISLYNQKTQALHYKSNNCLIFINFLFIFGLWTLAALKPLSNKISLFLKKTSALSESSKYKLVLTEARWTVPDSCRLSQVCTPCGLWCAWPLLTCRVIFCSSKGFFRKIPQPQFF